MQPWTPQSTAALASVAASLFRTGPWLTRWLQRLRPYICPFDAVLEQVPQGASVLDVGCGGGLLLALLSHFGRIDRGVGFDSSATAIDVARRMSQSADHGDQLTFHRIDVNSPWPAGSFDVVCLVDVMHHVAPRDQPAVFAEAAAHVRPSGRLLYKDIGTRPRWRACASRLHDLAMARQWVHFVPATRIDQWAHRQHLERIHAAEINVLWYGHVLQVYQK